MQQNAWRAAMRVGGLRAVRERLLVTQAELAQRSGVTESTISRLENGQQSARISTVRKLAVSLGVPPAELLDPITPPAPGTAAG